MVPQIGIGQGPFGELVGIRVDIADLQLCHRAVERIQRLTHRVNRLPGCVEAIGVPCLRIMLDHHGPALVLRIWRNDDGGNRLRVHGHEIGGVGLILRPEARLGADHVVMFGYRGKRCGNLHGPIGRGFDPHQPGILFGIDQTQQKLAFAGLQLISRALIKGD